MKITPLYLILGLLTTPGHSQRAGSDPDTQQQILEELRAIHRDLRSSTTFQLLLTELQMTQTSVDRATQRRDLLKAQDTQLQIDKASAKTDVDRFESVMEKIAKPEQEFVDRLKQLKDGLSKLTAQQSAASEQLQDAESRLRTSQAERDNVQGQLSELIKRLGADK